MTEIFASLDGLSPWWWVAIALAIGAVELVTFSYYLLWIAFAAGSVAAAMWISPGMSGAAQVMTFSALVLIYTVAGWKFVGKRKQSSEASALNNRATAMIGRHAVAAEAFRGDTGAIEIDGIRWRGKLSAPGAAVTAGSQMKVVGTEGMTLLLDRD
ncbi:MAG: NfeD family protein [Pseudomonadota bacterium]